MKKIAIIALLIASQWGMASSFENSNQRIAKYTAKQENTVVLPMHFAKDLIIDDSQLKQLKDKEIYLIELVYTEFRTSETFDQKQLNDDRIVELKNLVPGVKSANPKWVYIEQTGAKTRDVAKQYFHGFVIHYTDGLEYEDLKTFYSDFQTPVEKQQMNNSSGGELVAASGTKVMLNPNSVTYADGTPVKGEYTVTYKEFRDPADIAFSGIPMTFNASDGEYNFASVGMYELKAEQNGQELKLSQPAKIDFNCTEKKEDVGFYKMDEEGKWEKVKDIEVGAEVEIEEEVVEDVAVEENVVNNANDDAIWKGNRTIKWQGIFGTGGSRLEMEQKNDQEVKFGLNKKSWKIYRGLRAEVDTIDNIVISADEFKREVVVKSEHSDWFITAMLNPHLKGKFNMGDFMGVGLNFEATANRDLDGKAVKNQKGATLLASGADAGHTYPNMVKGLNSSNFGVYNCDQIYRIGRSMAIQPTYVDEETGEEIGDKHVACVLDLDYNGAFSFHPNYVNCNLDSRNIILLFTRDKEVYMLDQDAFAALDEENREPALQMKNMTGIIKNSDDLKGYLN